MLLNLNTKYWKEYKINEIFTLKGGFFNKKPEHSIPGNFPFLASTETNNGVTEYYCLEDIKYWDKIGNSDNSFDKKIYNGNCIAVTVNGSVCNAFYQKNKFTCSHDITALYLKNYYMNESIALFLCTIIMNEKYRWSYGRKPHDVKKFGESIIKLPITEQGELDWKFMEDYIKSLHSKRITTKNKPGQNELKVNEWKEFRVGDLFEVKNGKGLTQDEVEENPGDVEVIQGGESNNGSLGTISLDYCNTKKYIVIKEICLSVARVGTAGCINIQNKICAIGDKAKALILKHHKTLPIYLFLGTLLQSNSYKYSYGRGLVTESYMDTIIRLPVIPTGEPDREYMENYIKNLPYGDRI